ncbi:MAG TPA: ABC transporter ATP-binding protein [Flavisolibacter sp.]|nr:ABC transporter ATP-binding protein [Flavisolibacter sp.]
MLSVSKISKQDGSRFILKDVSFTQGKGQKIAIAGETGSGKSTLLKAIAGLAQLDSGEVLFKEERVLGPDERLIPGHKNIAYLSQHFELPHYYSVGNVLSYENRLTEEAANSIFDVCRITHLLDRDTQQLSGGEKQRISLARALIHSPELLLLDEPFSNMDMIHKSILKEVIYDVTNRLGVTCILVSHDPFDTISWADTLLVMQNGIIVQQGSPEQIYRQPVNIYVGALLGNYNLIQPSDLFTTLPGIALKGKSLFIRPEQFKVVNEHYTAMKGLVQHVSFYGSYYDVIVQIGQVVVTVRTMTCKAVKGEWLHITLSQDDVWYV